MAMEYNMNITKADRAGQLLMCYVIVSRKQKVFSKIFFTSFSTKTLRMHLFSKNKIFRKLKNMVSKEFGEAHHVEIPRRLGIAVRQRMEITKSLCDILEGTF